MVVCPRCSFPLVTTLWPYRCVRPLGWSLLLVLWGASLLASAQTDGDLIERVEIVGLTAYRPDQILPYLKTQAGEPYNGIVISEDIEALAKSMRTARVQAEPGAEGGLVVRFIVTEFPLLRQIQVIGNEKLKTERAEHLVGLTAGETLGEQALSRIRRQLNNEYRALGMPQARVRLELIDVLDEAGRPLVPAQVDLQIIADEGRQIQCLDVIIKGNQAFSAMRLRRVIQTKGSWMFIKNYYDDATFEDDLDSLRDFYAAMGYFDARIERGLFSERRVKDRVVLSPTVMIEEGQRYRFGKARVRGARLLSQAELLEPLQALEGEFHDGRKFARALEQVHSLYLDHGLLTTQIRPRYEHHAQEHRLDMLLEITEKDRIYVGKIKILPPTFDLSEEEGWFRGWYQYVSPPVKPEAIERELLLAPGDVYNHSLQNESRSWLARLGVLEAETLNIYNEPTAQAGVHNLVVAYSEAATGAIGGGVGFGDATGAFLFASFTERNFKGVADQLKVRLTLGTRDTTGEISYLNRHLGQSNQSLYGRLFYQTLSRPGYRANIGGAHLEWSRPLPDAWRMGLRGRTEFVSLSERDGIDSDEDLDLSYPVLTARLRAEHDTRTPAGGRARDGVLQSYGVELGYAGGPLALLEGRRQQYWSLSDRMTYNLAVSGGLMPYDRDTVPIHERLFLGGSDDLRGFSYRGAGYVDEDDDEVPIGGAAKLLVRNELAFPLFDPISGVVFADAGVLGRSPVSWQAPRLSTGLGLRLDIKKAQVGLDFALPLLAQDDDRTRFLHFSMRSAF